MKDLSLYELQNDARQQGKVDYFVWSQTQRTGEDPREVERRDNERRQEKLLAYSVYVRNNRDVKDQPVITRQGEPSMSQVNFTLEDIKNLIREELHGEREYTRTMVREEVKTHIEAHFQNFIRDNFDPALERIDRRFDLLEDHLDRHDVDVAHLKTNVRHVKQVLQMRGSTATAAGIS